MRGAAENQVRALAEEIGKGLQAALDENVAAGPLLAEDDRTSNIQHPTSNIEQHSKAVDANAASTRVLGPAPCPLPKLRGEFRYQLHLQGPDDGRLRDSIRRVTAAIQTSDDLRWTVDVDPIDMM